MFIFRLRCATQFSRLPVVGTGPITDATVEGGVEDDVHIPYFVACLTPLVCMMSFVRLQLHFQFSDWCERNAAKTLSCSTDTPPSLRTPEPLSFWAGLRLGKLLRHPAARWSSTRTPIQPYAKRFF